MSERETILARIQTVPSLPSVVIKLRQYLNEPDVNFDALARMIEYDQNFQIGPPYCCDASSGPAGSGGAPAGAASTERD